MTLAEAETAAARPGLPRRRRWLVWALLTVGLAGVALAIIAAVASRYQPIGNGEDLSFAFPGLPAGKGFRAVNNLGGFHQDIYVPPQRGTFALVATIMNNGTHPVTIVSASPPQGSGLWPAGTIRYSTPGMGGSNQIPPPTSRVLRNVVLAPGQEMFIGFPMKMWPCAPPGGWQGIPTFTVVTRYLFFTHTVDLPWFIFDDSVIMRIPGGKPGHKSVICAPGTTLANLPKAALRNPGPSRRLALPSASTQAMTPANFALSRGLRRTPP